VRRAALKRAKIEDLEANYYVSAPEILAEVYRRGSVLAYFGRDQSPPLMNMLVPNVVYMDRHCKWLRTSKLSDFAISQLPELRSGRPLTGFRPMGIQDSHRLAKRYALELLEFLHG
jgi:hypothetical protein